MGKKKTQRKPIRGSYIKHNNRLISGKKNRYQRDSSDGRIDVGWILVHL
jgi:hypothetical protein